MKVIQTAAGEHGPLGPCERPLHRNGGNRRGLLNNLKFRKRDM